MPSIGQFGTTVREVESEPLTFEFYGREFTANSDMGFATIKYAWQARQGAGTSTVEGQAAIYEFLRATVAGEEEWQDFEKLALANRTPIDDLFKITKAVIEASSARPTKQSNDSSSGGRRTKTGRKSKSVAKSDSDDSQVIDAEFGEPAGEIGQARLKELNGERETG